MGKKSLCRYAALMLAICIVLSGCGASVAQQSAEEIQEVSAPEQTFSTEDVQEETTRADTQPEETIPEETIPETTIPEETKPKRTVKQLSVAYYPEIPNEELFKSLLLEKWARLEPDVQLRLEPWDFYSSPSGKFDVLMYDAVVLAHLVENGYIQPITPEEIEDREGMIPCALDGAFYKGRYYGLPYFLCGDMLIYYKEDTELAGVENISQLYTVAKRKMKEDANTGVILGSLGSDPFYYLDSYVDFTEEYYSFEQLPDCTKLDKRLLRYLEELHSVTIELPEENLKTETKQDLFCRGYGFACFGMSEDMRDMGSIVDRLAVKKLAFAEEENIPLLYVDLISVSARVTDPEKLELCKELMNLVAGEDFLRDLCFARGEPQYLLPARESVYLAAKEEYPMYGQLHELVMDPQNRPFHAGPDYYKYIAAYYKAME